MFFKVRPFVFFLVVVISSCSVKEDRTGCPCFLKVVLDDPSNQVCDSLLVSVVGVSDNFRWSEVVYRPSFVTDLLVRVPSRDGVFVDVMDAGVARNYVGGLSGGLLIVEGDECPTAFMDFAYCPTEAEEVVDTVCVRKNYCGVSVDFVSGDLQDYRVDILGNVCGYSVSGDVLEGGFSFTPSSDDGTRCFFRLPRQTDSSLRLAITPSGGTTQYFALGNYILRSGYDWTAPDLDDIMIGIDYSATYFSVTISDWTLTEHFDIVF